MSLRGNPFNWIFACCTDNNNFKPALSIEDKFLSNCHSLIRYSVISVIISHHSCYISDQWTLFWWILFEIEKSVSRHIEWVLTKLNWNNLEFILFYELHWSSPSLTLKLKYLLTKIFCDLSDTKSPNTFLRIFTIEDKCHDVPPGSWCQLQVSAGYNVGSSALGGRALQGSGQGAKILINKKFRRKK